MDVGQGTVALTQKQGDDSTGTLIHQFSIYASNRQPDSDLVQELMVEEAIIYEQEQLREARAFRHLYEDKHGLRRLVFL